MSETTRDDTLKKQEPAPPSGTVAVSRDGSRRRSTSCSVEPMPKRLKPPGELLTNDEKRANHIASEHKRRQAIRQAYERLSDIVPNLDRSQSRKESIVLSETLTYLQKILARNEQLQNQVEQVGATVPKELQIDN